MQRSFFNARNELFDASESEMVDVNPYEPQTSLRFEVSSRLLPVNLVFSGMVALIAFLLAGFLANSALFYGLQWPGTTKSAIAFTILVVCLAYGMVRGKKELKQLRELTGNERQVGIIHIAIIVSFCVAIRGFVHWVSTNTSF